MHTPARLLSSQSRKLLFGLILSGSLTPAACAQEKTSQSILVIEETASPVTASPVTAKPAVSQGSAKPTVQPMNWSGPTPARLTASSKGRQPTIATDADLDVVRDRYSNGKVRVERHVTLDPEGNYVNHGEYREYSDKGDLVTTGQYDKGKRTGVWARFLTGSESPLLKNYPFNKLRAPFSSSVGFDGDRMNGAWVISDRDKRVACQIELQAGQRHGLMTLYHPNGQIYQQATYVKGVLDGQSIEKSMDGKVVREENYTDGRKLVVDTEHHPNKSVKSVTRYLSEAQQVAQPDDWATTTLATYATAGEKKLDGQFITYHENGQVATKGAYLNGKLHGPYESWFASGVVAASGTYHEGLQDGPWLWRHANGMKRSVATFEQGKLQGETRAWDENGKALTHP